MNKKKLLGQTFTEYSEVQKMLSLYKTNELINKKILEPTFGSGHFLIEIVSKMIESGRNIGYSEELISTKINENIWGFEIDFLHHQQCIRNLEALLEEKEFYVNIPFKNLIKGNCFEKLSVGELGSFDLIIGNPPYVKVQNFDEGTRKIREKSKLIKGNTDLFLIFIDFLRDFLSPKGEFIFIVPNSFGKSKSAFRLRQWMIDNGSIDYYDFESEQVFPSVSVYVCIFHFKKNSNGKSRFFSIKNSKNWILKFSNTFDAYQKINFKHDLMVRNGIATLCDKVFISDEKLDLESQYRVYKGSKSDIEKWIVFPYKVVKNKVVRFKSEDEFKKIFPKTYSYLLKNKAKLVNRSIEKKLFWFEFGRSQAINDLTKEKYLIDTLIKPGQKSLKIKKIPINSLVYSGLYTTSNYIFEYNNYKLIKRFRFISKDMRGGYKKISSSLFKNEF